jgi:hypothetical protein
MSDNTSRDAFEAWYLQNDYAYDPHAKHAMQAAWQASRKQALADAEALCRSLDNGDKQTTPTNCAEEIEVLK